MKFIVVVIVIVAVLWFSQRSAARRSPRPPRRGALPPPVAMVRCAHCGLHLPADEAQREGDLHYCSPAHRRLGPRP